MPDVFKVVDMRMSDIAAVGVGAPGLLDPDRGVVWSTPNMVGWENVPLARLLRDDFGVLAEAFQSGDTLVTEVIGRARFYLGILVASVVNLIDPEVVIFGGGVVEALGESFLEPIRRVAYQYFINKRNAKSVKIVPAELGDNAALLSAAVLARRRLGQGCEAARP